MRAGLVETLIRPVLQIGEVRGRGTGVALHLPLPPLASVLLPGNVSCCQPCISRRPQRLPLKEGIASFYDESSQLWESMWVS